MNPLRSQFLLRPDIHYLNFGSFGATPSPVFDSYQRWQRLLESEPVQFIAFDGVGYLAESRRALAEYLKVADAKVGRLNWLEPQQLNQCCQQEVIPRLK